MELGFTNKLLYDYDTAIKKIKELEEENRKLKERVEELEQCNLNLQTWIDNKEKVNKSMREELQRFKDLWDSGEF